MALTPGWHKHLQILREMENSTARDGAEIDYSFLGQEAARILSKKNTRILRAS